MKLTYLKILSIFIGFALLALGLFWTGQKLLDFVMSLYDKGYKFAPALIIGVLYILLFSFLAWMCFRETDKK